MRSHDLAGNSAPKKETIMNINVQKHRAGRSALEVKSIIVCRRLRNNRYTGETK